MKVEPGQGWALRFNFRRGGGFISSEVHRTKSDAINEYDLCFSQDGQYRRQRRRGEVKAVRVLVTEVEQ